MSGIVNLFRDLRRRKVFRGTGFYIVGAWSVVQVFDVLGDTLGLPAWTIDALLFLAVIGFPLAVWIAWRYELTDGRLVRTAPASADEAAAADLSLGAVDYVVLVALVGAVGFFAWRGLESIRVSSEIAEASTVAGAAAVDADDNTIAVLPFVDLSPDADQAYLADGVADTVLFVLSRVPELQVTARTSSFAFRDQALTAAQIAAALGVAHVLEGSVQRVGDQLRIIARVIDARTNREIWSANYDRRVDALFAIQDEIAESVSAALKVNVVDRGELVVAAYRPDLAALEQYILGKREAERRTTEGLAAAVERMERAIEIDPDYALAHVGLSNALRQQAVVLGKGYNTFANRVAALVDRALELDPTLAEAWIARGGLAMDQKDFPQAEAAVDRALELNPNLPVAYAARWNLLGFSGDREGQLAAIRKAVELDPESADYPQQLAYSLWSLARAEEAMATLKDNIRKHPDNPGNYTLLSRWLSQYGRPGEGMRYLQAIRDRDPGNMRLWFQTCEQYLQFWDKEGAERCLVAFLEANPQHLDARKWLIYARSYPEDAFEASRAAVAIGEQEVEGTPNFWYPRVQLAGNLLIRGEYDRVISVLSEPFPQLLGPEPELNDMTQWPARLLGEALWKSGRQADAKPLLDAVLAWVERSRKLQAGGWMAGIEDAMVYGILEQKKACLDALAEAVDRGWLFYSFGATFDTSFESVRDAPRFQAIMRDLEANARAEREYWYEHRDEPVI